MNNKEILKKAKELVELLEKQEEIGNDEKYFRSRANVNTRFWNSMEIQRKLFRLIW